MLFAREGMRDVIIRARLDEVALVFWPRKNESTLTLVDCIFVTFRTGVQLPSGPPIKNHHYMWWFFDILNWTEGLALGTIGSRAR